MRIVYINTNINNIDPLLRDSNVQKKEMENFLLKNKINYNNIVEFADENNHDQFMHRKKVKEMLKILNTHNHKELYILDLNVIDNDQIYALMIINQLKHQGIKIFIKNAYKIAGYVRVSTEKQTKKGVSISTQKQQIFDKLKSMEIISNINDIFFYVDDGYSGKSLNRPMVKEIINDIKKRNIVMLCLYDLARLSRDISDTNWMLALAKKYNVTAISVYDDLRYETAGDRMVTNIKASYNMYERERIVERTNDGLRHICFDQKRYPCGGKVRFGYYRGTDKQIYIHQENAKLFKKAVEMAKKRCRIDKIRDYLNDNQDERKFTVETVKEMLRDEKYAGIFIYKDIVHYDIVPPIVKIEDLKEANKFITKKKLKDNKMYLFDGIVFCKCGKKMSCTHSHGKSKKYYYYKCSNCNKTISQAKLENSVMYIETVGSSKNEENKIKSEYYRIKNKISELKNDYIKENITASEYCRCAVILEEEIKNIDSLISLSKETDTKEKYINMVTLDEKKKFLQRNFKEIVVDPQSKRIEKIIFN